jgi:hypothetical protein
MTEKGTGIYMTPRTFEDLLSDWDARQAKINDLEAANAVLTLKLKEARRALIEITQIIDGLTPDNAQHIKDLVIATIAEVVQDDRIS